MGRFFQFSIINYKKVNKGCIYWDESSRGAQIENYVSQHFWMQGISKAVTDEIEKIK